MLQDASVDTSPYSKEPVVNFQFNDEGKIRFASFTRRNVGQRFAIIVDRVVISAPVVKSEIAGGRGYIEGNFTTDTAKALVQKILPFRDQLLLKVEP